MNEKKVSIFQREMEIIDETHNFLEGDRSAKEYNNYLKNLLKNYTQLLKKSRKLNRDNDKHVSELKRLGIKMKNLVSNLSKYLPEELCKGITSGKRDVQLGHSKKRLCVFFSDIVDFTTFSKSIDTDTLCRSMNYYFSVIFDIAKKYGGTVDKIVGDGVLIFFGDPVTKGAKEDVRLCVHMAIEMKNALKKLEKKLSEMGNPMPIQTRIGISSGDCIVGNFGSNYRMNYTGIGAPVNLASRIQASAAFGEILISQDVYAHIKDEIYCESKGEQYYKGFLRPVPVYEVIDFFENIKPHDQIEQSFDGLSIFADFHTIRISQEKEDIIQTLEELVHKIKKIQ